MTQTTINTKITRTSDDGATIGGKFISWETLREAARQEDKELAAVYAEILKNAEAANKHRLISEDWKAYGYPLRTGFGQQYRGQAVMRAWEIRSLRRGGKDERIAYIVTWDRSDNTWTRTASPAFSDYEQALGWVVENYGPWYEEMGGERTADIWLYA